MRTSSDADKSDKSRAAATPGPQAPADSDYVIGADDTLRISVWKEPDLSETLPVRPDGKISMPLLERHSGGGIDSAATEGFDHGEAEEVHRRSASDGGGDRDEQPAHFCDRRSVCTAGP